jgi:hypothetical protein
LRISLLASFNSRELGGLIVSLLRAMLAPLFKKVPLARGYVGDAPSPFKPGTARLRAP